MSEPRPAHKRRKSFHLTCAAALTTLMTFALSSFACAQTADEPFVSLVAAERDFAADAARLGITPAFRAHAADDSILLRPAPVSALDHLSTQVDAADLKLEWSPAMAGIARTGDLGFTTGPYRLVQGNKVFGGSFLTIWCRGPDGRWRWFLDHGLPPRPETHQAPMPTEVRRFAAATIEKSGRAWHGIGEAEDALNQAYQQRGQLALLPVLAADGHLLRPDNNPVGKGDILQLAPDARHFVSADRLGARISKAGDLAVTYGRLDAVSGPPAFYVRVWRRAGSIWQLLVDELV